MMTVHEVRPTTFLLVVSDSTRLLNREWRSLAGKVRMIVLVPTDREIEERYSDLRTSGFSLEDDMDDNREVLRR